jgi:hypothetical protein
MAILNRLLRRFRRPVAPVDCNWKVWQYWGRELGWQPIATNRGPVEALEIAILADRLYPERHHRVSCRPQ